MSRFWKYKVRFRLARGLIHVGIFVMPDGRYKSEMLAGLWALRVKVRTEVASAHPA